MSSVVQNSVFSDVASLEAGVHLIIEMIFMQVPLRLKMLWRNLQGQRNLGGGFNGVSLVGKFPNIDSGIRLDTLLQLLSFVVLRRSTVGSFLFQN